MVRARNMLIGTSLVLFIASSIILFISLSRQKPLAPAPVPEASTATMDISSTPSETIPPNTPLVIGTPTNTLRPPPTFEPPTMTAAPSNTPPPTPSPTVGVDIDLIGVHGLETATPSSTPGCQLRREWTRLYEVQPLDALERIATQHGIPVWELAAANCLDNPNMIYVGQQLRVPGNAEDQPVECVPWEVLTPIDWAYNVDGAGELTFNWRGPQAPRNLIRVFNSDGIVVFERTVDLRQNETIELKDTLLDEGLYTWYVYPLGMDFIQINCREGGPWTFHKNSGE